MLTRLLCLIFGHKSLLHYEGEYVFKLPLQYSDTKFKAGHIEFCKKCGTAYLVREDI